MIIACRHERSLTYQLFNMIGISWGYSSYLYIYQVLHKIRCSPNAKGVLSISCYVLKLVRWAGSCCRDWARRATPTLSQAALTGAAGSVANCPQRRDRLCAHERPGLGELAHRPACARHPPRAAQPCVNLFTSIFKKTSIYRA